MENLTEEELQAIDSEKSWRLIARRDAAQDIAEKSNNESLSTKDAISGFFDLKRNIVFCNERRQDLYDSARRAYVAELVLKGFTEQAAWEETYRINWER